MPKIEYREKKLGAGSLTIIGQANVILEEYTKQGFDLTLRQLYYQFVARGLIPNNVKSYKRLGSIIDDGRMCGLIDWDRIEDRTRNLESRAAWGSPGDVIDSAFQSYHLSRWQGQPYRVEVWCEKEALIGIFARACTRWDVPYFACRGYVSQSEMWRAAMRLQRYTDAGQDPVILHFGDHDPSGVDMTRDIRDRLRVFGTEVDVRRLALNMDQVERFKPPPNPAKQTDARFESYVAEHGEESWELDALDPKTLTGLVEGSIHELRDVDLWRAVVEKEVDERARLCTLHERWVSISDHLDDRYADHLAGSRDRIAGFDEYRAEMKAK